MVMQEAFDHIKTQEVSDADAPIKILNVKFQTKLNLVVVRGTSIGDSSAHKYEQLTQDIIAHFRSGNSLHLYFNFDFLDSSALAYLASIFSSLNEYHRKGKNIKLFWSCLSVADNMNDEGEKLQTICEFEFYR